MRGFWDMSEVIAYLYFNSNFRKFFQKCKNIFATWQMVVILVGARGWSCLIHFWMGTTQWPFKSILFHYLISKIAFLWEKKRMSFKKRNLGIHIAFRYLLTSINDFNVGNYITRNKDWLTWFIEFLEDWIDDFL